MKGPRQTVSLEENDNTILVTNNTRFVSVLKVVGSSKAWSNSRFILYFETQFNYSV